MSMAAMGKDEKKTRQSAEVTPIAKAALEEMSEWSGVSQKLIVERLILGVADLSRDLQGAFIGALPMARKPEFAKMLLDEIAAKDDVAGKIGGESRSRGEDRIAAKNAENDEIGRDRP